MPPGEQKTRLILLRDDDANTRPQNAQLKEIFLEQEIDIQSLTIKLEMAKWNIRYLEERNKQLEEQHVIMELQNIREDRLTAQQRRIEFTSLEQQVIDDRESVLERVNMHLENMLNKADEDNTLLRHMARRYRAWNLSLRARIRSLKAKLRKATKKEKREKEQDSLRILAEASLAQLGTP